MKKLFCLCSLIILLTSCRYGEVDDNLIYRTPQLRGEEFQKAVDDYGVKTIINLRGENLNEEWYQAEKLVAEKNNITLINIGMSAKSLPHRSNLIKLLDALRDAPKPILIHCKAGVDRTGEASALYQMIYMNYSKKEALKMLTPKWAHFEKLMPAKRYFIRDIWQGEEWARNSYYPCQQNYKYYNKNNSECTSQGTSKDILSADEDT